MDSNKKKKRLRVGTFNVHGFANGRLENTFDEICHLLGEANLDILGLQEASGALLPELVRKLGKDAYKLATKFGGTAILTRLPIVDNSTAKPGKGRYCCCEVMLPVNDGDDIQTCRFIVLHLDHRKEQTRMDEVKVIVKTFERNGAPLPQVWVGDFNALTRADYTHQEWNQIAQVRQKNRWEPPISDLTSIMTAPAEKTTPLSKGLGLSDAFASVPPTNRSGPLGTSRFDTRIDYVYFDAQHFNKAGWTISACDHVDSKKFSDHNLVIATFEK